MKYRSLADFIATFGGSGRMGSAPGSIGSAEACILMRFIPASAMPWVMALFFGMGLWSSDRHARDLGQEDPGEIIIDEVVGQWLALWGHMVSADTAVYLLPGFALFRFFDILKPWPVKLFERLPGGLGIMADDLVAGLMANLCLCAFRYFFLQQGLTGILAW